MAVVVDQLLYWGRAEQESCIGGWLVLTVYGLWRRCGAASFSHAGACRKGEEPNGDDAIRDGQTFKQSIFRIEQA